MLCLLTVSLPLLLLLSEEEYHYHPLPPREEVQSMSDASFDMTVSKSDSQRLITCFILLSHTVFTRLLIAIFFSSGQLLDKFNICLTVHH